MYGRIGLRHVRSRLRDVPSYFARLVALVTACLIAATSPNGLVNILDVVATTASLVLAIVSDVVSTFDKTFTMDGSAWMTVLFTVRRTSEVWSISGDILFSRESKRLDSRYRTNVIDAMTPILIMDPARYQITRMLVAVELRFI